EPRAECRAGISRDREPPLPMRTDISQILIIGAGLPPLPSGERVGVRGRGALGLMEDRREPLQHAFEIPENFVVPEANRAVSELTQLPVPRRISCAVGVLTTIDLDHETAFNTQEVGGPAPD